MRQAGRYLPEYLAIRADNKIKKIIASAELTEEVTWQPIRRYDFDAAIIFADILTPLAGLGIEFDFLEGEGPKIFNPVKDINDVNRLAAFDLGSVSSTLSAISSMSPALAKMDKPLIGFAGAPFTLSSYLIEAQSAPNLHKTKKFMFNQPEVWQQLQQKLVAMLTEYLLAQVKSGAAALQIFDSWLGGLSPQQYRLFVEPYLQELLANIRKETNVPIIFFATGVTGLFPEFSRLPVDVLGVDWRLSLIQAAKYSNNSYALQGNLDPLTLFGSKEYLLQEVQRILQEGREIPGYIFNLGHGILPATPLESVAAVVEAVKLVKWN